MILVEFEALPLSGPEETLRFSTEGFVSAPTCTVAPDKVYVDRVLSVGSLARFLWKSGRAQGVTTEASVGNIDLGNLDGELDALWQWDFDGRKIRILQLNPGVRRRDQAVLLFSGTMERAEHPGQVVRLVIRDRVGEVARAVAQPIRYAGTNSGGAGVEGNATDIKGLPKPWLVGEVENFAPPRVNTSNDTYEISCKPIAELVAVWSNAAALAPGVQRANLAALQANAPASGSYDWTLGSSTEGAYFRLGSSVPKGTDITCYAREGATAADRTPAQVAKRMLLAAPNVTSADIDAASVTALDVAQSGVTGWWFEPVEGKTLGEGIDAILGGVGVSWTPRSDGLFAFYQLVIPTGPPVATILPIHILRDVDFTAGAAGSGGIPNYEVALSWGHNWKVGKVSGVVSSEERREWLAQEYRTKTVQNTAIWDPATKTGRNPSSEPLKVVSQLRTEAAATVEANRLLALFSVKRRMLAFSIAKAALPDTLDLGQVVSIVFPRWGLNAGGLFVITGITREWGSEMLNLEVWGG